MQRHGRGILIVTVAALAGFTPMPSVASVLCKNSRGNLLVRDACRSHEQMLTPEAVDELGLRGPAGPVGPPGPPGGGVHVVDANGGEVGIVTSLNSYAQQARVVRKMTLPDSTTPEFVVFSVTTAGLSTSSYACGYYGTYYRSPDCTGDRFQSCEYGSCSSATGAFLFIDLAAGEDGIACFARGGAEFERGDFYQQFQVSDSSNDGVTQECTASGGTIIGAIEPCSPGSTSFCGQCCAVTHDAGVAPIHAVDLSTVGTPPFRLSR